MINNCDQRCLCRTGKALLPEYNRIRLGKNKYLWHLSMMTIEQQRRHGNELCVLLLFIFTILICLILVKITSGMIYLPVAEGASSGNVREVPWLGKSVSDQYIITKKKKNEIRNGLFTGLFYSLIKVN